MFLPSSSSWASSSSAFLSLSCTISRLATEAKERFVGAAAEGEGSDPDAAGGEVEDVERGGGERSVGGSGLDEAGLSFWDGDRSQETGGEEGSCRTEPDPEGLTLTGVEGNFVSIFPNWSEKFMEKHPEQQRVSKIWAMELHCVNF